MSDKPKQAPSRKVRQKPEMGPWRGRCAMCGLEPGWSLMPSHSVKATPGGYQGGMLQIPDWKAPGAGLAITCLRCGYVWWAELADPRPTLSVSTQPLPSPGEVKERPTFGLSFWLWLVIFCASGMAVIAAIYRYLS